MKNDKHEPDTPIHRWVNAAREGREPRAVARLFSGWVLFGERQFVRGYVLLLPDPVVPSLNALAARERTQFLLDMARLGDAMLKATDAVRINYAILGNRDPALHAHIIPRYADEPEARLGDVDTHVELIVFEERGGRRVRPQDIARPEIERLDPRRSRTLDGELRDVGLDLVELSSGRGDLRACDLYILDARAGLEEARRGPSLRSARGGLEHVLRTRAVKEHVERLLLSVSLGDLGS